MEAGREKGKLGCLMCSAQSIMEGHAWVETPFIRKKTKRQTDRQRQTARVINNSNNKLEERARETWGGGGGRGEGREKQNERKRDRETKRETAPFLFFFKEKQKRLMEVD